METFFDTCWDFSERKKAVVPTCFAFPFCFSTLLFILSSALLCSLSLRKLDAKIRELFNYHKNYANLWINLLRLVVALFLYARMILSNELKNKHKNQLSGRRLYYCYYNASRHHFKKSFTHAQTTCDIIISITMNDVK